MFTKYYFQAAEKRKVQFGADLDRLTYGLLVSAEFKSWAATCPDYRGTLPLPSDLYFLLCKPGVYVQLAPASPSFQLLGV